MDDQHRRMMISIHWFLPKLSHKLYMGICCLKAFKNVLRKQKWRYINYRDFWFIFYNFHNFLYIFNWRIILFILFCFRLYFFQLFLLLFWSIFCLLFWFYRRIILYNFNLLYFDLLFYNGISDRMRLLFTTVLVSNLILPLS